MANDFLLKEVRRQLKIKVDEGEVWKKLETLLGDNIKEAVLDSEIQVKKQELTAIKQDIVTATEQWGKDCGKREMETKAEVAKLDKYLTTKQKENELGLTDLKNQSEKKEAEYKNVLRSQEQRVSGAQKKADQGVQEILGEAERRKREIKQELVSLGELRDEMKEEVRVYQQRFGARVE